VSRYGGGEAWPLSLTPQHSMSPAVHSAPGRSSAGPATLAAVLLFGPQGFDLVAARRLPANIRFGASSWKYPGWRGQIYLRDYASKRAFEDGCLEEYGEFPWFRALGLDHTFYNPPTRAQLERYARQLPASTAWLSKVWERLTLPRFSRNPRHGELAGRDNPRFLDPTLFRDGFLPPFECEALLAHTGPFILQFADTFSRAVERDELLSRLHAFLAGVPEGLRFAVEVRTPSILADDRYFALLNRHGATHVFNHQGRMPPLVEQMKLAACAGGLTAGFYVARLLTPLGVEYADSVARFQPYDRLQAPQEQMRDDVVRLARRAIDLGAEAWILVNNRVEGNSPATVDALGRRIVQAVGVSDAD
jgi:uncharacterized protein YecE (DUF72 family)